MASPLYTYVLLGIARQDTVGKIFFADTLNRTISQNIVYTDVLVVLVDPTNPQTVGNPTVSQYLTLMAALSPPHVPVQITNTFILTRQSGT